MLILPHRSDLEEPTWRRFTDELQSHGVEVLDLSGPLEDQGGMANPGLWTESGAWSEDAHARVAARLAEYVSQVP